MFKKTRNMNCSDKFTVRRRLVSACEPSAVDSICLHILRKSCSLRYHWAKKLKNEIYDWKLKRIWWYFYMSDPQFQWPQQQIRMYITKCSSWLFGDYPPPPKKKSIAEPSKKPLETIAMIRYTESTIIAWYILSSH